MLPCGFMGCQPAHEAASCLMHVTQSWQLCSDNMVLDWMCAPSHTTYGLPGGPLGWLYPFEIQPLETRPAGGAVASLMNLLFSFVIGKILPA